MSGYKERAYNSGYEDGIDEARVCPRCEQRVVTRKAKHGWRIRLIMRRHLDECEGGEEA